MSNTWVIDPHKMAMQRQALAGTVAVAAMLRATKFLAADQGELTYNVSFAMDEDSVCVLNGELHAVVTLCCQRCLQNFSQKVQGEFIVSPVSSDEEAKQLPSCYEPVLMNAGRLDILEMLEDELILSLPQVPMHEQSECKAAIQVKQNEVQDMNPFQILQKLKLKEDK